MIYLLLLFSTAVFAQDTPSLHQVKVKDVVYSGSGCEPNTVMSDISPDGEVLTLIFNKYIVEKRAPEELKGQRKSCRIRLGLEIPQGFSYGFFQFDMEGAADLQASLIGEQKTRYSVDDQNYFRLGDFVLKGQFADEYRRSDDFTMRNLKWSDCQKQSHSLFIDTSVHIRPESGEENQASGFMSVNATEGSIKQNIGLVWKPCGGPVQNKSLAKCHVPIRNRKAHHAKDLTTKFRGKNAAKSLEEAKKKIEAQCTNINQKGRDICKLQEISCVGVEL